MKFVFLTHLASTLFMVGVIWFVQVVHYPLFANVGREQFRTYEQRHQRWTTWVVGPAMLLELLTAIALFRDAGPESPAVAWIGLGLIAIIWLTTALLSVPAHAALTAEFSPQAYRRLVSTNWIRTVAWTARGILLLMLTCRSMA